MKSFDANELLDKVKTENMLLLDKVKNLELELSVAKEQINRSTSSKFEHMLSIQKSPLDKTGLAFEDSITISKSYSTNFVSCKLLSEQISQKCLCFKHNILWYLLVNW